MSVTGLPGQGPVRVGIPIADLCGGIFAAYGITVALLERESSGKGQWLHTSLLEAMVYMMDFQTSRWTIDGEIPAQAGQLPSHQHPDRRLQDAATATSTSPSSAARSGSASPRRMGAPEWITDERSKTKAGRSCNRDWLNAEIEKRLAAQDQRPLDRAAQRGRRRLRAHQRHARGLRRAAGAAPGHGARRWSRRAWASSAWSASRCTLERTPIHHRARGPAPRRAHRGGAGRARLRPPRTSPA